MIKDPVSDASTRLVTLENTLKDCRQDKLAKLVLNKEVSEPQAAVLKEIVARVTRCESALFRRENYQIVDNIEPFSVENIEKRLTGLEAELFRQHNYLRQEDWNQKKIAEGKPFRKSKVTNKDLNASKKQLVRKKSKIIEFLEASKNSTTVGKLKECSTDEARAQNVHNNPYNGSGNSAKGKEDEHKLPRTRSKLIAFIEASEGSRAEKFDRQYESEPPTIICECLDAMDNNSKDNNTNSSKKTAKELSNASIKTESNASYSSGTLVVEGDCKNAFNELRLRRKHRYIMYGIESGKIKIMKLGNKSEQLEELLQALPESDCSYVVYDHEYKTKDGRMADKLLFITWCPHAAPTTLKMLYTSERIKVASWITGAFELTAANEEDIKQYLGIEEDNHDESEGDSWLDD